MAEISQINTTSNATPKNKSNAASYGEDVRHSLALSNPGRKKIAMVVGFC